MHDLWCFQLPGIMFHPAFTMNPCLQSALSSQNETRTRTPLPRDRRYQMQAFALWGQLGQWSAVWWETLVRLKSMQILPGMVPDSWCRNSLVLQTDCSTCLGWLLSGHPGGGEASGRSSCCCGYAWSVMVRLVGCTAKFSERPLERARDREMILQLPGNSSGGRSCRQPVSYTLPHQPADDTSAPFQRPKAHLSKSPAVCSASGSATAVSWMDYLGDLTTLWSDEWPVSERNRPFGYREKVQLVKRSRNKSVALIFFLSVYNIWMKDACFWLLVCFCQSKFEFTHFGLTWTCGLILNLTISGNNVQTCSFLYKISADHNWKVHHVHRCRDSQWGKFLDLWWWCWRTTWLTVANLVRSGKDSPLNSRLVLTFPVKDSVMDR